MKRFLSFLAAAALMTSAAYAETAMNTEQVRVQNEIQNRFHRMGTDELLEMRGQMHNQQEREALHKIPHIPPTTAKPKEPLRQKQEKLTHLRYN